MLDGANLSARMVRWRLHPPSMLVSGAVPVPKPAPPRSRSGPVAALYGRLPTGNEACALES